VKSQVDSKKLCDISQWTIEIGQQKIFIKLVIVVDVLSMVYFYEIQFGHKGLLCPHQVFWVANG
jgi:hypothetical protein